VILVNDEVSEPEVGERGERPAEPAVRARRALAEDLRVGKQDDAEVPPDEAASRRRNGVQHAGLRRCSLAGLEWLELRPPQERLRPQRLATMRERDHHALAGPNEPRELRFRLRKPARGDGGPLRVERERLAAWERIEVDHPAQIDRGTSSLLPCFDDVGRLPHDVGSAIDGRHGCCRIVRDDLEPALRRGVDDHTVERMERALGERRERAKLLDLVAVELDPNRLAPRGRENVDDAAAHCELSSLLDAVDARVARVGEQLRESLHPDLLAYLEGDRIRPLRDGWHAFGDREGRCAHEPAGREHVERAEALTDEVRRWGETRVRADAPSGQKGDACVAEVPRSGFGRVARIRVGRQQDEQAARQLGVQCGEDERKRRLGDAGASGKRGDERAEAVEAEELVDEGAQRWRSGVVHGFDGLVPRLADANDVRPAARHLPLRGLQRSLKRACAGSIPSPTIASTASADRATISSRSSAVSKGERT
jgi:hypothetical protein